ncbi:MAG TPA: dTDP-4-dehydrorhamnose 3,5-epimerase [Acidobacteriaceae bacterium]|jgi:dTDP-4-dehydrorhamnose 3,5-epimerase|nr:dTDP-4-dehydrorhamnose 3,5-epimerase [Acidobacteriaceae bacterium]
MKLTSTRIADLKVLEPTVYEDSRGVFFESYNQRTLAQAGLPEHFVQDNQSLSYKGVLRGLHYQIKQPQGKLVRCLRGEVFDVAVDLRKSSPSFGQWEAIRLSEQNRLSFWIPPGFAHGFLVLSQSAEVLYKTTDFYAPKYERTVLWNDPTIHIEWPLQVQPNLSGKDLAGATFEQAEVYD